MGFQFDEERYRLTYNGRLVSKFRKDATRMHALCRDISGCPSNGGIVGCSVWGIQYDDEQNRQRVQKTVSVFNAKQFESGGRLLRLQTRNYGRQIVINYDRVDDE